MGSSKHLTPESREVIHYYEIIVKMDISCMLYQIEISNPFDFKIFTFGPCIALIPNNVYY